MQEKEKGGGSSSSSEWKPGEFIILPTLDYPDEGLRSFASKRLSELMGMEQKVTDPSKGILLNEEDLKDISDQYAKNHQQPLVHVYAANSPKAALPPSKIGAAKREGGQARFYQGWGDKEGRGPDRNGNPWLTVAGIPTITAPVGAPGAEETSEEEIKFYIKQLYFFLAQGKGVCIPVRRRDWGPDNKIVKREHTDFAPNNDKSTFSLGGKSYPISLMPSRILSATSGEWVPAFEYAFGGGNARFDKNKFLETELDKLNIFAKYLQALKRQPNEGELNQLVAKFGLDPSYIGAIKQGFADPTAEALLPNPYAEASKKEQKKQNETVIKSENPIWKTISKQGFTEYFSKLGHTVTQKGNKTVEIAVKSDEEGKGVEGNISLMLQETGHVIASAKNPTPKVQETMAEAMAQALGRKGKVRIEINPKGSNYEALYSALWLKAMNQGLEVLGKAPEDGEIVKQGNEALKQFRDTGGKKIENVDELLRRREKGKDKQENTEKEKETEGPKVNR